MYVYTISESLFYLHVVCTCMCVCVCIYICVCVFISFFMTKTGEGWGLRGLGEKGFGVVISAASSSPSFLCLCCRCCLSRGVHQPPPAVWRVWRCVFSFFFFFFFVATFRANCLALFSSWKGQISDPGHQPRCWRQQQQQRAHNAQWPGLVPCRECWCPARRTWCLYSTPSRLLPEEFPTLADSERPSASPVGVDRPETPINSYEEKKAKEKSLLTNWNKIVRVVIWGFMNKEGMKNVNEEGMNMKEWSHTNALAPQHTSSI